MRITALLLLTGSTLLYSGGQAQAQIQSLSYTSKPKIIQTPDNQGSKSKLYVTPKAQVAETESDDPLGLTARDLDEDSKEEMDRVFELYKALSAQQSAEAANQPMKTEPTRNTSGSETMHTISPTKAEEPQSSPGSFASILERYQSKKASGTPTNSLDITDPKSLIAQACRPRRAC